MNIQETVWQYLRSKGLLENSVAAIMGNIEQESSFDETQIEVGIGIGFGLFQWSYERRTQLEAYGKDLTHQLKFFWSELTGENTSATGGEYQWRDKSGYLSHAEFMSGQGSTDRLTEAFCVCWERAGIPMMQNRIGAAQKYYSQFTGTQADSANSNSDNLNIEATNYQIVANSEKKGNVFFGRRYRITVSDNNGNALDVSDLHCTFNIIKTIQMEPNSSEITIYNLNAITENKIMLSGKRVTVEAGYEGTQFGLIFDGDILQTIREKENGNTYKLTIIALDSDRAINFEIVNFSIARGQTARSIIDHIANKASNPINLGSISSKLEGQTLTRGKVLFGKASDYIRQIAKSYDLHFYMDDGSLNLISMDELPEGEIFELSPASGLIGTPTQTDYGVSGQCLLNPQIKLNSLIHIDNSSVRAKQIDISSNSSSPSVAATTNNSDNAPTVNNVRQTIISEAKKLCDDPNVQYSEYLRGQTVNGITYYDCSKFTEHCYSVAGLYLNPTSELQWAQCKAKGLTKIDISAAIAGDLVFWFHGDDAYHVAIYGGNNDIYAARTDNKEPVDQVAYGPIYNDGTGGYIIARTDELISADGGELPSANNDNSANTDASQTLFRSLDKDGIYRVIKMTYEGDTRGDDWYISFETITQAGGIIPSVAN